MDNSRDLKIQKKIDAYVKGKLPEDEIQALWDEFAKNPHLLDLLEIEAGIKKILTDQVNKPATVKKMPRWTWHIAAAAVVLIVVLVQLFRVDTPTDIEQFVVREIGPAQIETADALRNDEVVITTADSLLNLGFSAFMSGDNERALQLFRRVTNEFNHEPYASKAYLNLGIIYYNEGNYEQAVSAFRTSAERAEHSRMISEKAYWYLGNALINVGELEQARTAIYEAYKLEGVFRSAAFRLLQKLNYDLGTSDYEDFDAQRLD